MNTSDSLGPLMMDIEGLTLGDEDRDILRNPAVGGLILFSRNFGSIEQLSQLITEVRQLRQNIIIAVDQEGGRVQRFKESLTRLPPPADIGHLFEKDPPAAHVFARELGWIMAAEMLALGLDISFAPVLDLAYGRSSVIGDRALHSNPEVVTSLASEYITGMNDAGMAATGKHFPGHGAVGADSHLELPIDSRNLEEIKRRDLIPFSSLARRLAGIMPAHIVYEKIDCFPAGFSSYWLQTVLRKDIRFDGVVFSDDLSMEGAAKTGSYIDRAKQALSAGCDMILVCNCRDGVNSLLASKLLTHYKSNQNRLFSLKAKPKCLNIDELKSSTRYIAVQEMIASYSI